VKSAQAQRHTVVHASFAGICWRGCQFQQEGYDPHRPVVLVILCRAGIVVCMADGFCAADGGCPAAVYDSLAAVVAGRRLQVLTTACLLRQVRTGTRLSCLVRMQERSIAEN
jgi:hypothetical protein